MATAARPYVGYEVRIPAGPPHRGITTDPKQCLAEHRERLGADAFIRVITPPLSLRKPASGRKCWSAKAIRH